MEKITHLRRIELPPGLTFGAAQRLQRIGITPVPVSDLAYLVYPWVVDCQALRANKFSDDTNCLPLDSFPKESSSCT